MAVPKKRHSKSKVGRRRLHLFLEKPDFIVCVKCGRLILPHIVCPFCGFYKGREVIDVLAKLNKRERKQKEKELKAKEKEEKGKNKEKPLNWKDLSKR